jgi:hypothetical protein
LCTSASNGGDISSLTLFNDTIWAASYFEGDYGDQYQGSFIVLRLLLQEIDVNFEYKIDIDRNNTLKKACVNTTESLVTVGISNSSVVEYSGYYDNTTLTYGIGSIAIDNGMRDTKCFIYDSSLTFFPPHQQLDLGVNVTLALPFAFGSGDYIKIKLPGISNGFNNYPLNPRLWSDSDGRMYDHGYSVTHAGSDVSNIKLTYSTKYNWTADWYEGNTTDAFADSYAILYPSNASGIGEYFWVSLERFGNNFAAVCGTHKNNSKYTIEIVADSYVTNAFSVNETTFSYVSGIGTHSLTRTWLYPLTMFVRIMMTILLLSTLQSTRVLRMGLWTALIDPSLPRISNCWGARICSSRTIYKGYLPSSFIHLLFLPDDLILFQV